MRIIFFVIMAYMLASCGGADQHNHEGHNHDHGDHDHTEHEHEASPKGDGVHYGAVVEEAGAISLADIVSKIKSGEELVDFSLGEEHTVKAIPTKIEGKVSAVCQKAGCWLEIADENGTSMRILTDHEFLVEPDIVNKTIVVEGNAYESITTVAELKHYAEDDGQSEEEIAKITEPISQYKILAKGLVIKQ